jgi:hypothetical protein
MAENSLVKYTETNPRQYCHCKEKKMKMAYECRWKNSRGEARHRQFTVTVAFVALINETFSPPTYFNLSVILAFLLAIGVGVGIKFYLSKVSEPKF